ncbi:MAG TPA: transglutaminase domain-containing protein [Chitinophagaceae bacterium]|nr:transglutaminase domain-containing protein [Chitinophagaceae bacterium]
MSIGKVHSWKKVIAQLVLLAVPTAALIFFLLQNINQSESILQNNWLNQGLYFTGAMAAAIVFYSFRFRVITTTGILFIALYFFYKLSPSLAVGELDAFNIQINVLSFCLLVALGWLAGTGFARWRFYTIFWCLLLLGLEIYAVSRTTDIKASALITAFAPILVYAFYIIYMAELIRNMSKEEKYFSWFVLKRVFGFFVLIAVILLSIYYLFQKDFNAIEKEWGGSQANYKDKGNSESMTKDNKDGTISNKDQTKLTGSLSRDQRLVFVAHLDNFFPDGKTPNPLYFTAYYFTKFDTMTQTFERDPNMPDNDLFTPDPSKIPLYFAKTDSSVIKNTHATLGRKIINTEVYKVFMAADDFVAPSTSFFCQPIPVPNEYKSQYRSAYRAKMYVSELNSAYFIYNPAGNKQIEDFQKIRFDILRGVTDFSKLDRKFYNYYTFMPKNEDYDKIRELAAQLGTGAKTPADKMLAIRNYFLSKDEYGQPLYKYSDNPGIPGLPSANKLNYFLFQNRKGYCAYFAGATLFLLRAMGIPSRVAVGYLTEDRSSKNPGWYWFYEKQAHAWVQVYFPGYGWIDFDTTIPSTDHRDAPQPDQTPPLNMQQAYFVADGTVTDIDTVKKRMEMDVSKIIFHDKDYNSKTTQHIVTDVSLATVSTDTGTVRLSYIKKGMHVTAASYSESLKNLSANETDSMKAVIAKLPKVIPIDEIKVIEPESQAQKKKNATEQPGKPIDWIQVLWITLIVLGSLLLLTFAAPWLIMQYLAAAAGARKEERKKAFDTYTAVMFYLNQLGYFRTNYGPQQYARMIDKQFGTTFESFSNIYQKLKYSNIPLTDAEKQVVNTFYKPFIKQVRGQVSFSTRLSRFLNIYNTIHFFTQPKIS